MKTQQTIPIKITIDPQRKISDVAQIRRPARTPVVMALAALISIAGATADSAYAKFNVPTDATSSPLFGAQPFTQQMLMFEEFGTQPLPSSAPAHSLPISGIGCSGPTITDTTGATSAWNTNLDNFLSQPLFPAPQEFANTSLPNPWASAISGCLGRPVTGVIEGRPPGQDFAHQRYGEFTPEVYFQSAQAGARMNGGFRDSAQEHHYSVGEFGPGGLYHNTTGLPGFDGTTRGIQIRFHPNMPIQDPQALWTFDGTLPPKLLKAPYGTTILFRHYDALPISDAANRGFGAHTITTHEHNGHNPGESDGFAGAYFFPGEFYDYRWPMVLAGHDSINTGATDPRAGTPDGHGGIRNIPGDWHETMSTHWFHDHMLDSTAQNVYKGNAVMMNYYSAIDRGREPANAAEATDSSTNPGYACNYANPNNVNLCLPSGSGLDYGNRDYDINLVMADKAFDSSGQLYFATLNTDGFLGDVATVNFLYKPYFDVRARKYRFRILNGSVSRYWKVALVDQAGNQVPFHLIANDGNLMEHTIPFPNVESPEGLPSQGIAERYDIIVDFSKFKDGDKLYFVNLMEHEDGKTPKQAIPLAQVLSGAYASAGCPKSCDPLVGKFMELRVHAMQPGAVDLSMNPADYEPGKKTMIPLPGFTASELANARERTFSFNRGGDQKIWTVATDGGQSFNASSPSPTGQVFQEGVFNRVSAAFEKGALEIWHIKNGGQGWSHPVHVHFEEGQILQRGGKAPPIWEKWARKDVYRIGPLADATDSVDIAIRIREFMGTYVEHCHNTQHEDNAMLLRWDSMNPGQIVPIQSPFPTWDGVTYLATNTTDVPTFKTGKQTDFLTKIVPPVAANDTATTTVGSAVQIRVLDNDVCVGTCDPASVTIGTAPANGTAVVNADGTVTYTPNAAGSDSFTYTVRDTTTGTQTSNIATVSVTIGAGTGPSKPVAVNDSATTSQNTVIGIPVTANDSNCGSGCTVAIVAQPSHGTVVANSPASGQVTYSPTAGFTGIDTFSYTATNAGGTSNTASVTVTVTPNPVTDVVTIRTIRTRANGTGVQMNGSITRLNGTFATAVDVFDGLANASHTGCAGNKLAGTARISSLGGWTYSGLGITSGAICVQSSNGGVADSVLP